MKAQLEKNIARHITLSPEDRELFCSLFSVKNIAKKDFLLRAGEVCRMEAFVTQGLLKMYDIDEQGHEHILLFAKSDWWITDIDSFTNQTPSNLYIEALEDSQVLYISKVDKEFAYANIAAVEKLFRIMTQKTHVALQRRLVDQLSKNADEAYEDFTAQYPEFAQRLSNIQIAAYLGISHEFLSKIRRKLASRRNAT